MSGQTLEAATPGTPTPAAPTPTGSPSRPITTVGIAALEADPHGVFRRFRPEAPVIIREGLGYLVLRARDIEVLIKDPRLRSAETEYPEQRGVTNGAMFDLFKFGMLTSNGEIHRARRSPFTKLFAARLIAEWRPIIRKTAERLVDSWDGEDGVDLVSRYAALVPAYAISQILGLPEEDITHFTAMVYEVSRFFGSTFTAADIPQMEAATLDLQNYSERLLAQRRKAPTGDFLSAFLETAEQRGELSEFEMIIQVAQLILGGTDSTRVAMGIQVGVLLQHREQWDAICHDQSLIPGAVTEALRYEPSVASVPRFTLEDIVLDGFVVPGQRFVTLSTMSMNRDETVLDQPDVFNIRRTDHPRLHPAFGGGAHRCIGEALARAELEETLSVLATKIPGLRLADGPPEVKGHAGIRRLSTLPVCW